MNIGQFESRSISLLCSLSGYSRQAFYRFRKDAEREALQHDLILQGVVYSQNIKAGWHTKITFYDAGFYEATSHSNWQRCLV